MKKVSHSDIFIRIHPIYLSIHSDLSQLTEKDNLPIEIVNEYFQLVMIKGTLWPTQLVWHCLPREKELV